jgi:hypothetical protein
VATPKWTRQDLEQSGACGSGQHCHGPIDRRDANRTITVGEALRSQKNEHHLATYTYSSQSTTTLNVKTKKCREPNSTNINKTILQKVFLLSYIRSTEHKQSCHMNVTIPPLRALKSCPPLCPPSDCDGLLVFLRIPICFSCLLSSFLYV